MDHSQRLCSPVLALRIAAIFVFASLAGQATVRAEAPTAETFFPAGLQQGTTVEVEVRGKCEPWPPQVWVDASGVEVSAAEEKNRLVVTAAENAEPGVYWVRLYNPDGAAAALPLVVGTRPEMVESEPNDRLEEAQMVEHPGVIANGRLAKGNDVDVYALRLETGTQLVAEVEANRTLGSPMDGVLQVTDALGFVLAQNDDAPGLDPRIVFTAPRDGTYRIRIFAFPATPNSSIRFSGQAQFVYRLLIRRGAVLRTTRPLAVVAGSTTDVALLGWNIPESLRELSITASPGSATLTVWNPEIAGRATIAVVDHPSELEVEPNDKDQPQAIDWPVTMSGVLETEGDVDAYRLAAMAGQTLRIRVDARSLGFPTDPLIQVLASDGKKLQEVDDTGGRDAELIFKVPKDGEYVVRVTDRFTHGGPWHLYRLDIDEDRPDFQLSLAGETYVVEAGKNVEIPVNVARSGGLKSEIVVGPIGLPPGVVAENVLSASEGDSAKQVKLVLTAAATAPAHSGPIQVEGRISGKPQESRQATIPLKAGTTGNHIWLTVKPKS